MATCPECQAQLDSMHVSGCWKCGAGFRAGSSWKPVATKRVSGQSPDSPVVPSFRSILEFTAPVWGIVLATLFVSTLGNRSNSSGVFLLIVGALLPFAFLSRISEMSSVGGGGKLFLFILYYAGSCVAMFAAGWGTLLHLGGPK